MSVPMLFKNNFDEEDELKAIFESYKNPQRIIELLPLIVETPHLHENSSPQGRIPQKKIDNSAVS